MADATKYLNANCGCSLLSHLKTRKLVTFAYGFMLAFVAFTVFLAFSPTSNAFSPGFTNIFSSTSLPCSLKSHFTSLSYFFFPNISSPSHPHIFSIHANATNKKNIPFSISKTLINQTIVLPLNYTQRPVRSNDNRSVKANQSTSGVASPNFLASPPLQTILISQKKNLSSVGVVNNNHRASLTKKKRNCNVTRVKNELIESLMKCDLFNGKWVRDDSYPLYKPDSCRLIDVQFNCAGNGRPDNDYQKYKWKPRGCSLPTLDGSHFIDMLRGKRVAFVGDSLNRNMWESLVCMLRNSVKDKSKVYEANGRVKLRGRTSYSFVFKDYNFTVEFFESPFLVQEWKAVGKNVTRKPTLRLDLFDKSGREYKDADIIIFNTGHWWNHEKTSKGKDYYQEGDHVYEELNVIEAFRRAITTWSRWVDANVNPSKSMVFFRGYSATHFSGGQWNSGGQCDSETLPTDNEKYLTEYPEKMRVLENVMENMKTSVTYMNITMMTDFRKDGHPSMYRRPRLHLRIQDCSHWCLPGVPDAWNEILYAQLLVRIYQNQKHNKRT